jgi:hypothetical protein
MLATLMYFEIIEILKVIIITRDIIIDKDKT